MTDYTKEAEELYPVPNIEDFEDSKDWSFVREENGFKRAAHIVARQQSAAEIDRLRGEVERLKGLLHETWNKQYPHPQYVQDLWQQFKTENNIQ